MGGCRHRNMGIFKTCCALLCVYTLASMAHEAAVPQGEEHVLSKHMMSDAIVPEVELVEDSELASADAPPPPTAVCQCTDQADWITTAGYGCVHGYLSTADCETYGTDTDANGVLPASACCICGGGTCVASTPTTAPTVAAPTAACECTDQADWITTAGYGCVNGYLSTADCETYGTDTDANGVLPASACCICGGGTCVGLS